MALGGGGRHHQRFYHDIRRYSFLHRIINRPTCNSLPDFVVNVDSINIFKNRPDTFWSDQDIKLCLIIGYNTAELTGIRDRSEFLSEN